MNKQIYLIAICISSILVGCWGDDKDVTQNHILRKVTLWDKDAQEHFRIDLSGRNNSYGSFSIEQEGKTIMALDFTSILSNNGRTITFQAIPREDLLTDWQRKHMKDDADYTITVVLDQQSNQYLMQLKDVPPGYEDKYTNAAIGYKMFLKKGIVNEYFNEIEYQELKQVNGTGAALYFGNWVNLIYEYLFWPYAIIFALLSIGRGKGAFWNHVILTVILYITFNWDFAPARAFIASYYLCTPLLYIPPVRNSLIFIVAILGAIISMAILGYKEWLYVGLFEWIFDIACWSIATIITGIIFLSDLRERCPNCGRFALSWRGRTDRFDKAVEHFKYLKPDGSDADDIVKDPEKITLNHTRCAHCFYLSNGEYSS